MPCTPASWPLQPRDAWVQQAFDEKLAQRAGAWEHVLSAEQDQRLKKHLGSRGQLPGGEFQWGWCACSLC